jgi:GT2 family glycosyltransferase
MWKSIVRKRPKHGKIRCSDFIKQINMDVSIIIVNTNEKLLLKQALKSVFEKTKDINFEVIVVDNASRDGTQQMVREEFPNVILVESENKGFGHANNVGAQYAKGKYLFLLNPDTVVLNNAVKILAEFLDNNPKVGICGGNLFDEKMGPSQSYFALRGTITSELKLLLHLADKSCFNHSSRSKKVGMIIGADLMIRKNIFEAINGFDEMFFMYYEEAELSYRVTKKGYKIYSVPQATIIHFGQQSFLSKDDFNRKTAKSLSLYLIKTNKGFMVKIIRFTTIITRLMLSYMLRRKKALEHWKKEYEVWRYNRVIEIID